MALTGSRHLCNTYTRTLYTQLPPRRPFLVPSSPSWCYQPKSSFTVSANRRSSKTGRFDRKNKRSSISTKEQVEEKGGGENQWTDEISNSGSVGAVDDGFVMRKLPGDEPDFWEGPQWDTLGFVELLCSTSGPLASFLRGMFLCIVDCIAAAIYNEGATDFKDTLVYKEGIYPISR